MLVLEALFEFHKERVLQLDKNALLGHYIFFLMFFDDIFLLENLHGVDLVV